MLIKTYKFRLYPSKAQTLKLEQTLELCRELYNAGLQERRDAYRLNKISISYFDQANQLSEIKTVNSDYKAVHSQVLQDILRRLDRTFKSFFDRVKKGEKAGFPRFKGQNRFDSFCYPQSGFSMTESKLTLSKIGRLKIKLSRPVIGKTKTCTIRREIDKWFVIFTVEIEKIPLPKTGLSVGIDVGLNAFATLSNGEQVDNPRFFRTAERRLKTAHRNITRKKKGSNNRRKAVALLAKQHLKIKRQRLDFFHKTSLNLIRRFDEIAVEDLNICGMVKNSHLAKSINDASWGNFLAILESKAENASKRVWKVNARNTSQICSQCGENVPKALSVRTHSCPNCGLNTNRDINAAKNILVRAEPLLMSSVTMADEARILR